jgi:hypothetical protein
MPSPSSPEPLTQWAIYHRSEPKIKKHAIPIPCHCHGVMAFLSYTLHGSYLAENTFYIHYKCDLCGNIYTEVVNAKMFLPY